MSAAVETAAPTPSCLTSHYPGFTPGAAATQGKAPPPQNNGERQVPWLNPYNPTTSSKSNKLEAKDSQWGCFPHFLPKMHQLGLKAIPGPGVEGKMANGSGTSNQVGEPKPIPPRGGREGSRRSRRFGPSIITPQPATNNPLLRKVEQNGAKHVSGTKAHVKGKIRREEAGGHQACYWEGRGGRENVASTPAGELYSLLNLPTRRHPRHSGHQFGGKGRLTSPLGCYLAYLPQAVALGPRLAPPPLQSATGSAASPSAIRDPAKQYVKSKSRAAQPREEKSDGGDPVGEEAAPSPRKTWGPRATAETVGAQPRERENELRKGKIPRDLPPPRPGQPPPPERPPPLASASPSPPGLALTLAALRAAREDACDMSGARRRPRGPDAAAATAAAPRVASASASSSRGCAAPSHPHYRRTWAGKTAGISLTRFWLRLRGTNLPSPGPPPFGNTHNSARSSPGFSAGEEEEAEETEAAAVRPSPERPRPPRPHWLAGKAGRGASGTSIGYICLPSGPPSGGWSERLSVRRRPHPPGVAVPLPPSARSRPSGQAARVSPPAAPATGSGPGRPRCPPGPGTARESEAVAACPGSGLGAQAAAAAPNDPARGETRPRCPQRPPCPVPEAPREGRARARAGAIESGRSGQRVKWVPERAAGSGSASTLASPPWGIVPPPPVMAAGGDDVLHFVGTAVGTWDQFKTRPRGAGKLVPAKPQLGSAIRPGGRPLMPASASEGPWGTGATVERPRRRSPPPSTKMEEAAGSPGAGLPPVGRAGASPRCVPRRCRRPPPRPLSVALPQPLPGLPTAFHHRLVLNGRWGLYSTACSIASPNRGRPGCGEPSEGARRCGAPRGGCARRSHIDDGASLLFIVYTYVFGARQGAVRHPRFHVKMKARPLSSHPSGGSWDYN
ncbi:basic proline-rich protein-like [Herpailurus yagouaroundi]|uniref:basic proline-rich protein-like n=1 Tax=Herpailurus yagouaroundi TaxID=1608482 RepID=UPI001AD78B8B|nr:basic proline-rich protein-like [Puma yagouaroundi]